MGAGLGSPPLAAQQSAVGPKPAWVIVPRISLTETLTDNGRLSASRGASGSEQITQITPGIRIPGGRIGAAQGLSRLRTQPDLLRAAFERQQNPEFPQRLRHPGSRRGLAVSRRRRQYFPGQHFGLRHPVVVECQHQREQYRDVLLPALSLHPGASFRLCRIPGALYPLDDAFRWQYLDQHRQQSMERQSARRGRVRWPEFGPSTPCARMSSAAPGAITNPSGFLATFTGSRIASGASASRPAARPTTSPAPTGKPEPPTATGSIGVPPTGPMFRLSRERRFFGDGHSFTHDPPDAAFFLALQRYQGRQRHASVGVHSRRNDLRPVSGADSSRNHGPPGTRSAGGSVYPKTGPISGSAGVFRLPPRPRFPGARI